jgi:hypothetical protein
LFTLLVVGIVGLIVGAAVGAGTASAFSNYDQNELVGLEGKTNTISDATAKALRAIDHGMTKTEEWLGAVTVATNELLRQANITVTHELDAEVLSLATSEVSRLENILAALAQNRLHPSILDGRNVSLIYTQLRQKAESMGLVVMASHFIDLLQFQASFVTDDSTPNFKAYLHVPLTRADAILQVYEYTALPFEMDEHKFFLNIDAADHRYLAVSADNGVFRSMSSADFRACRQVGTSYFCDRGNVVRNVPDFTKEPEKEQPQTELCLIALFHEQYAYAKHHCRVILSPATARVTQIGATKFAFFATHPHQAIMSCPTPSANRKPTQRKVSSRSGAVIEVPVGCSVVTKDHTFASSDIAFTRNAGPYVVTYSWPHELYDVIHGVNMSRVAALHKSMQSGIGNRTHFTLKEALKELEEVPRHVVKPHFISFINIAITAAAILAALVGAYVLYNAMKRTQIGPTAPPPAGPQALAFIKSMI